MDVDRGRMLLKGTRIQAVQKRISLVPGAELLKNEIAALLWVWKYTVLSLTLAEDAV